MFKFFHDNYHRAILILIIVFLIVNFPGIRYGLPLHLIGDEESIVGGAMKMFELKTLIPAQYPAEFDFFYYPPLIAYLIIIFLIPILAFKFIILGFSLLNVQSYFALNLATIWLVARSLTLFFSAGVIGVTYCIGREHFGKRAGFLAALLLSLSFFQNNLAHWAKHWVFATFFVYLTFLAATYLVSGKKIPRIAVAVSASLAVGTSFVSGLALPFIAAYLWLKRKYLSCFWRFVLVNLGVFLLIGGGLALLNYPEIFKLLGPEDGTITAAKSFSGLIGYYLYALSALFNQETAILILSASSLFILRKRLKENFFIYVFASFYILCLYLFLHIELRYLYFILPALAISGALVLDELFIRVKAKYAAPLLAFAILLWPGLCALRYNYLINQPDTRQEAVYWIQDNIDPGEAFILNAPNIALSRSVGSLEEAQTYGRINAKERYFLRFHDELPAGLYPEVLYDYQNLHFWSTDSGLEKIDGYIAEKKPAYLIIEDSGQSVHAELADHIAGRSGLELEIRQSDLPENYDLNGNFYAFNSVIFKLRRLGPPIRIYKINY